MKISNKLPRFSKPTLVVVSSSSGSVFYLANDDEIVAVAQFHVEKPQYSDREDFGRRADGAVYESGKIDEKEKRAVIRDFRNYFVDTLLFLGRKFGIQSVYMFTTKHIYHLIEKFIPRRYRGMVAMHIKGDYSKKHVFDLLGKIETEKKRETRVLA